MISVLVGLLLKCEQGNDVLRYPNTINIMGIFKNCHRVDFSNIVAIVFMSTLDRLIFLKDSRSRMSGVVL